MESSPHRRAARRPSAAAGPETLPRILDPVGCSSVPALAHRPVRASRNHLAAHDVSGPLFYHQHTNRRHSDRVCCALLFTLSIGCPILSATAWRHTRKKHLTPTHLSSNQHASHTRTLRGPGPNADKSQSHSTPRGWIMQEPADRTQLEETGRLFAAMISNPNSPPASQAARLKSLLPVAEKNFNGALDNLEFELVRPSRYLEG